MGNSALYGICIILGGAGAWIVGHYAGSIGLIAQPNSRSSHDEPLPNGGGMGILAAFLVSSIVLKISLTFWIPAALLSLLSFLGDRIEVSFKIRLLVQFAAALILLSVCFSSDQFPVLNIYLTILLILVCAVYIVGTANFYNFMDGIDGISGITGIVGFGLIALHTHISGNIGTFTFLSICISLACLGFLPFNMPQAKVFMGDVGAVLLGFVFSGMVVLLSRDLLDFICLAAFLFPFYADELTTMVVRIKDHDRLTEAHRKHFYQLLANEKCIDHWKISTGYGIAQLIIGLTILALKPFGIIPVLLGLALFFSAFIWADYHLRSSISSEQYESGA